MFKPIQKRVLGKNIINVGHHGKHVGLRKLLRIYLVLPVGQFVLAALPLINDAIIVCDEYFGPCFPFELLLKEKGPVDKHHLAKGSQYRSNVTKSMNEFRFKFDSLSHLSSHVFREQLVVTFDLGYPGRVGFDLLINSGTHLFYLLIP